ncbi:MAG: terminase, partial [Mycobacterium sp.]
ACKTRDFIADLRAKVAAEGSIIDSRQGPRLHPAAVETRMASLALLKLVGGLGLPKGAIDDIDDGSR